MSTIRLIRILAAAIVATIAAWSSYWHMLHVALRHGERSEVAYVLPLSVDGVLIVAAIVMAEDRRANHPVRPIAKAAFLTGLTASIAANIAAAQPTPAGRLIAAWPAIALLLIVEMLVFHRRGPDAAATKPYGQPATEQHPSPSPKATTGPTTPEHPPELHHMFHPEHLSTFHPERHRDIHREPDRNPTPEHHRQAHPEHPPAEVTKRRRPTSTTRQLAADILTTEPNLTREEVAARIGISTRRLRTILSTLPPRDPPDRIG